MDNLDLDAVAATSTGMSYGYWKSLHPHTKEEKREPVRTCRNCGKSLDLAERRKKYCDLYCYSQYKRKQKENKDA